MTVNEWATASHATAYLARADAVPHRTEGEAVVLELVGGPGRVLDLGCGDGRLLALVGAGGVALDFSPSMLDAARARFAAAGRDDVTVVAHDLDQPMPASLGTFDAVVSSFAIHHVSHERKRSLYAEVFSLLTPGGVFVNLEHVASPTPALHGAFLRAVGGEEDPSNQLLDVATQLGWLSEIGFVDVDCFWKWRELAVLAGWKARPAGVSRGG